jgi:hypothetical protein
MQNTTTFSIEDQINPETGKPFGSKYAGTFSIRRPTIADKTNIALKCAATLAAAGGNGLDIISNELMDMNFLFSQLLVIKTGTLPEWFDREALFDEDESAIQAVAREVRGFIDSFRTQNSGGAGKPAGQGNTLLVPAEI